MTDDLTRRSAEEFLAGKFLKTEEDAEKNRAATAPLAPAVWRKFCQAVAEQCKAWNSVTGEETLTIKETYVGDLRISCAGRPQQLTIHFDSRKLTVTMRNTARL